MLVDHLLDGRRARHRRALADSAEAAPTRTPRHAKSGASTVGRTLRSTSNLSNASRCLCSCFAMWRITGAAGGRRNTASWPS